MTPSRLAIMDLAEGYMYTSVALLIPMPKPTDNAESLVKPFQLSVNNIRTYNFYSLLCVTKGH